MDAGHKYADDILEKIAEQIADELNLAGKRAVEKLKKHLKKYDGKIKEKRHEVENGDISERDYYQWVIKEVTTDKDWAKVRDNIAEDLTTAQENAIKGTAVLLTAVYLYNRNFMNDAIETAVRTIEKRAINLPRIRIHKPIVPKYPKHAKNRLWHRRKLDAVIRNRMKKGHSIDKIADSLYQVTDMDIQACYRTARTGVTAAENMARIDSFLDAERLGLKVEKQWYATKDSRTRTSHRVIDGERRPIRKRFSNGLMYPADPDGEPAEVYNCRCTLLGVMNDIEILSVPKSPVGIGRYEWVGQKPKSKPYPYKGKRGKYKR